MLSGSTAPPPNSCSRPSNSRQYRPVPSTRNSCASARCALPVRSLGLSASPAHAASHHPGRPKTCPPEFEPGRIRPSMSLARDSRRTQTSGVIPSGLEIDVMRRSTVEANSMIWSARCVAPGNFNSRNARAIAGSTSAKSTGHRRPSSTLTATMARLTNASFSSSSTFVAGARGSIMTQLLTCSAQANERRRM